MEGKPLQYEVYTGAAYSLISEDTYYRTWKKTLPGFQASRSTCAHGQEKSYTSWAPQKFL